MPNAWRAQLEDLLDAGLRDGSPADPFRVALLRWAAETGRDADPDPLLTMLEQSVASGYGARRFRWHVPMGQWVPLENRRRWRTAEGSLPSGTRTTMPADSGFRRCSWSTSRGCRSWQQARMPRWRLAPG